MTGILLLYLLALVDFGCCGYRAAGGRLATLDKSKYFTSAIVRAALLGHLVLAVMVLALAIAFGLEPDRTRLWADMQRSAQAALCVYVPYATVVFVAMVMRVIPSIDLKSIACTVLLGPLLFVRPLIVILGILAAAFAAPSPVIISVALLMMALVSVFERLLEYLYDMRYERQGA